MKVLRQYSDKLLLALCAVLFLGASAWAWISLGRDENAGPLLPVGGITPAKYEPTAVEMPSIAQVAWPEPPPQSPPRRWVYDAFTPPVIYYNELTKEWTMTPPEYNLVEAAPVEQPFDVELVSVRQEPYRIQLVGYVVNEGDRIAQILVIETGEIILARPGIVYPESRGDFTLKSFEVKREERVSDDSMAVVEQVGRAVVIDGRTGREVALNNHEYHMLPRLQCVLRSRVYPPEEHVLREGMTITVNGYEYLVTQLSLNPAQAVVTRKDPKSFSGERRTLTPVGATAGARDISIDSFRVSLFSSSRHLP